MTEETYDEILALIQRESRYLFYRDGIKLTNQGMKRGDSPSTVIRQDEGGASIYAKDMMRSKMCEWMYKVVDYCDIDRKVTFIAMYYYDAYFHHKNIEDLNYPGDIEIFSQLLGLSAIYLACKTEGSCTRTISLEMFVKLSCGRFSEKDLKEMEVDIMFTLQWLLNPPSPRDFSICFISQLSHAMKVTHQQDLPCLVFEVSNYIIEVIIQFNDFKGIKSSIIACASTLLSLKGIRKEVIPRQEQIRFLLLKNAEFVNVSSMNEILSMETLIETKLNSHFFGSLDDIYANFDPMLTTYETISDPPILL